MERMVLSWQADVARSAGLVNVSYLIVGLTPQALRCRALSAFAGEPYDYSREGRDYLTI
jgi:hypothetical protein